MRSILFFNICHSAIHCKESFNFAVVEIGISVQANGISRVEVVASNLTNHEWILSSVVYFLQISNIVDTSKSSINGYVFFTNLHNPTSRKFANLSNGLVACKQTLNHEMLSYNFNSFTYVNLLKIHKESCNFTHSFVIRVIIKKKLIYF